MDFSIDDICKLFEQFNISPYDLAYDKKVYEELVLTALEQNEALGDFIDDLFEFDDNDIYSLKVFSWEDLEDEWRKAIGIEKPSYFTKEELEAAFNLFRKNTQGKTDEQLEEELNKFLDANTPMEQIVLLSEM